MKDKKKAEDIANHRMQVLLPLLQEGMDAAKLKQLRIQISEQTGLSERTIRRYLASYTKGGFEFLKPKNKTKAFLQEAIPSSVLEQAILLRREVPTRSVSQLIQILEWEGIVPEGSIKRSTLQEKLANAGYSTRHMKLYSQKGIATRRFQKRSRNALWHSDIKYGPYIPLGSNGEKKQVYLVTFLDDSTRFVLHGEFYPTLDQLIVEDCFRKSIIKYGLPDSVYFDNGKQYRTKWMTRTCSKLQVRLIFAKPYSPEATGKIERFNRVVDGFLQEINIEKNITLDKLNQLFQVWLEECYQNKNHSALKENQTPSSAFRSDSKPLKLIDSDTLCNAFLHSEDRKVDKAGCVSFQGKKYEVGIQFVGCTVGVVYDPADLSTLTIEYQDYMPWKVRELNIGDFIGEKPKVPSHFGIHPTDSSRLLRAASQKNNLRHDQVSQAISFRYIAEEDEKHV